MPRTARASCGGYCYHVINRGNGRAAVFHKDGDYRAFVKLIGDSVLDFLRRIAAPGSVREAADADLLARFVAYRDEAAFAGLVQRRFVLPTRRLTSRVQSPGRESAA